MRTRTIHRLLLGAALALVVAAPGAAESARDVLETAMKRHEARLAKIAGFTVVQDVMGMEITTRYEKRLVDGHPELVTVGEGGQQGLPYSGFRKMLEGATLDGKKTIDGRDCDVVRIADPSGFDPMDGVGDTGVDMTTKQVTFFLDRDDSVMRRMLVEGETMQNGRKTPVTMEMNLLDFRETDGWLHPFRTEMTMSGVADSMSSEEMEEAERGLKEMKEQLATMDPEQRKMMQSMMGGAMAKLEEMVSTGEMKTVLTVKEIRVDREG